MAGVRKCLWLLPVALAATACRTTVEDATSPHVGVAMILPPAAAVMDVPDDRVFLMATTIKRVMPAYPPVLLDAGVRDQAVCAEIVVGEDGGVRDVTPLFDIPECPESRAQTPAPFLQAVEDALLQWQFFAAATCTFPEGMATNDACEGHGVRVEPVAIKLAFVFEFTREGDVRISDVPRAP